MFKATKLPVWIIVYFQSQDSSIPMRVEDRNVIISVIIVY